ncbi:hypothetical protein Hanom_Chr10g00910581 [Helianthus anomalus]
MNTQGNIPFTWENRPGVRKDYSSTKEGRLPPPPCKDHDNFSTREGRRVSLHDNSSTKEGRLPPPPYENLNKATCQDLGLPLPPCVFQPRLKSSLSRRSNKDDDPFLMAYKECTKSHKKSSLMRKNSLFGSCKYSCNLRDDSIVRVSQIPVSNTNSDGKRLHTSRLDI